MTPLIDIIGNIRDFINSPRKQHLLIADKAEWNKLCSSLDVIEDTELAVQAYHNMKPKTDGEVYIVIYGILQILIVQQDAVKHIAESLSLNYEPDKLLLNIRDIRNNSIGHPTKRGAGKGTKFNFIIRNGMNSKGFSLMTTFADNLKPQLKHVNISDIIVKQKIKLTQLLSKILNILKEEEMKHRKQFQDEKLNDIFPHTLSYYFEKISESINENMPSSFGAGMIDIINEHIINFKNALNRRGLLESLGNVTSLFDLLEYPIKELKNYFTDRSNSKLNDKDARIFAFFIREHIAELQDIAKEIDNDYTTELNVSGG